jgi:hypothetical protein
VKRKTYFDEERAFEFIWQNPDRDGIWHGDAASLREEFEISEDDAEEVLDQLRARRLIEKLHTGVFFICNWRQKKLLDEEKL